MKKEDIKTPAEQLKYDIHRTGVKMRRLRRKGKEEEAAEVEKLLISLKEKAKKGTAAAEPKAEKVAPAAKAVKATKEAKPAKEVKPVKATKAAPAPKAEKTAKAAPAPKAEKTAKAAPAPKVEKKASTKKA